MKKTKFEEDLEAFFPEIFKLHQYSKGEKYVWDVVYAIMKMRDEDASGSIFVRFQRGHIDKVTRQEDLTFGQKLRPLTNKD